MNFFSLCCNAKLEDFYRHCFLTTPCSKNVKELLGFKSDQYDRYMSCRKRNFELLDNDIKDVFAESLKEHYSNIQSRVERMVNNPYKVISNEGQVTDIILYDFFRLVKNTDHLEDCTQKVIRVYVRKDLKAQQIGSIESDWVELNLIDLYEKGVFAEKTLNYGVTILKNYLYLYATFAEFFEGGELNRYPRLCYGKAYFVYEAFMNFSTSGVVDLTRDYDYKFFGEKKGKGEYVLTERIAALIEFLDYSADPLFEKLDSNLFGIYQELETFFNVKGWEYAKEQYNLASRLLSGFDSPVVSSIKAYLFLEENKAFIKIWQKENDNKLVYIFIKILRIEYVSTRDISDFFSYDKLVVSSGADLEIGKFPSKKAVRHFFALDQESFLGVMGVITAERKNVADKIFWRNIMLYLMGDYDLTHFNQTNIYLAEKAIKGLYHDIPQYALDQNVLRYIGKAIDLMMQQITWDIKNDTFNRDMHTLGLVCDYLNGNQYLSDGEKIKRTNTKNITRISNATTVKSLLRKTNEWHDDIIKYQAAKVAKNEQKRALKTYKHIDSINVTIDGCEFTAIENEIVLWEEAVKLMHCISDYHERIKKKGYIAFSIKDNSALREGYSGGNEYTLGIYVVYNIRGKKVLNFDQCQGYKNTNPPTHVVIAARKLVNHLYCDAHGCIRLINNRRVDTT